MNEQNKNRICIKSVETIIKCVCYLARTGEIIKVNGGITDHL